MFLPCGLPSFSVVFPQPWTVPVHFWTDLYSAEGSRVTLCGPLGLPVCTALSRTLPCEPQPSCPPGTPPPSGLCLGPHCRHCALETAGGSRDYLSPFICLPSRKDRCLLLREKKKKSCCFSHVFISEFFNFLTCGEHVNLVSVISSGAEAEACMSGASIPWQALSIIRGVSLSPYTCY